MTTLGSIADPEAAVNFLLGLVAPGATVAKAKDTLALLASNPREFFRQQEEYAKKFRRDQNWTSEALMSVMPEVRQQAEEQALQDAMGFLGITTYHGSPHKFDKFDASKIGTGEGAQAYGYGLYLADSPAVAGSYKNMMPANQASPSYEKALTAWRMGRGDRAAAIEYLSHQERIATQEGQHWVGGGKQQLQAIAEAKKLINSKDFNPGNLYTVDLPDEWLPKMLDWDKPLSEQPKNVQSALKKLGLPGKTLEPGQQAGQLGWQLYDKKTGHLADSRVFRTEQEANQFLNNPTAGEVYEFLSSGSHGPMQQQTSSNLNAAGIPGIKYLDAVSRDAGEGTYNYVVFPGMEGLLKILKRE